MLFVVLKTFFESGIALVSFEIMSHNPIICFAFYSCFLWHHHDCVRHCQRHTLSPVPGSVSLYKVGKKKSMRYSRCSYTMNFSNAVIFLSLFFSCFLANSNFSFLPDISLPLSAETPGALLPPFTAWPLACLCWEVDQGTHLPKEQQENNFSWLPGVSTFKHHHVPSAISLGQFCLPAFRDAKRLLDSY